MTLNKLLKTMIVILNNKKRNDKSDLTNSVCGVLFELEISKIEKMQIIKMQLANAVYQRNLF